MASEKLEEALRFVTDQAEWSLSRMEERKSTEFKTMSELRDRKWQGQHAMIWIREEKPTDKQVAKRYPELVRLAVTNSHWDRIKPEVTE